MTRRRASKLVHKRPTHDLMIQTLGRSLRTVKTVAELSGCKYSKVSSILASMHRLGIVAREDHVMPYLYKVADAHRHRIRDGDGMIG